MRGVIVAGVLVMLALLATPVEATTWHVVKHGSASGQFAVTAISATVKHPKALGVRMIGNVSNASVIVACSKGFSVSSNSWSYNHAGTYRLPMTKGADFCDITASVGGSGKVVVQILKG